MATATLLHVVRPGEHLAELAVRYGTDAATIWALALNEGLKSAGRTPEILCAGDLLHVPSVERRFAPVTVGQVNTFTASVPTVELTVKVTGTDGKGLANEAFEAPSLGVNGTTDADGTIQLKKVPCTLKFVDVLLPVKGVRLTLRVGYLDPVSTPAGKAQRLTHLGYLRWDGTKPDASSLARALSWSAGTVAPTASSDADIEQALATAHGS